MQCWCLAAVAMGVTHLPRWSDYFLKFFKSFFLNIILCLVVSQIFYPWFDLIICQCFVVINCPIHGLVCLDFEQWGYVVAQHQLLRAMLWQNWGITRVLISFLIVVNMWLVQVYRWSNQQKNYFWAHVSVCDTNTMRDPSNIHIRYQYILSSFLFF